MLLPKIKYFKNPIAIHKLYKDAFAYYIYEDKIIYINLYQHYNYFKNEDELIINLCKTIGHEHLHFTILESRMQYGDKLRYDFFEEKIITELMEEEWDEEEYYYLIQEEK